MAAAHASSSPPGAVEQASFGPTLEPMAGKPSLLMLEWRAWSWRCRDELVTQGILPLQRKDRTIKPWDQTTRLSHGNLAKRDAASHTVPWAWPVEEVVRLSCPSRIEAQMNRLMLFGERIVSRNPDRQVAEIHIRLAIMNHCSAMGMAEIERVK